MVLGVMYRFIYFAVLLMMPVMASAAVTFKGGKITSEATTSTGPQDRITIEMPPSPIDNLQLAEVFPFDTNNALSVKNRASLSTKLADDFFFANGSLNKCIPDNLDVSSRYSVGSIHHCMGLVGLDFYRTGSVRVMQDMLLEIARADAITYEVKPDDFSPERYHARGVLTVYPAFYALYYDHFDYPDAERKIVDSYLLKQVKAINMDEVGEYRNQIFCDPRNHDNIGADGYGRADQNTCESTRWKATIAQLLMGLRFKDEELFKRGIYNARFMLLLFDDGGVFVPWAVRGGLAVHYSLDVPVFLTLLTEIFAALNYDFLNHELETGLRVKELYPVYFKILFEDKSPLDRYSVRQYATKGDNYKAYLKRSAAEESKRWNMTQQNIARESYRFIRETAPQFNDMIECDYNTRDLEGEPVRVSSGFNLIDSFDLYLMNYSSAQAGSPEPCLSGLTITEDARKASRLNRAYEAPQQSRIHKSVAALSAHWSQQGYKLTDDALMDGQYRCRMTGIRHLYNGDQISEEKPIFTGYLNITGGVLSLVDPSWSTGNSVSWKQIAPFTTLAFTEDGHLTGALSTLTMFGGDQLEIFEFNADSRQHSSSVLPEGRFLAKGEMDVDIVLDIHRCVQ